MKRASAKPPYRVALELAAYASELPFCPGFALRMILVLRACPANLFDASATCGSLCRSGKIYKYIE